MMIVIIKIIVTINPVAAVFNFKVLYYFDQVVYCKKTCTLSVSEDMLLDTMLFEAARAVEGFETI